MLKRAVNPYFASVLVCTVGGCNAVKAEDSLKLPSNIIVENCVHTQVKDTKNNFLVVYDSRTKCPKYAIEKLTKETFIDKSTEDKKRPPFHAESTIKQDSFRV